MADLLPPGSYSVFSNAEELAKIVRDEQTVDLEQRKENAAWVAKHHSFYARAREIMAIIRAHPKSRAMAA